MSSHGDIDSLHSWDNGTQATDIVTAYVIGIVICQAMKIAGTHVGKIAIYEETAGREHYGDEKKNPCWSM